MARTDVPGVTGKPLIESDRVEGTAVYGANSNRIGSFKRLMIEKMTVKVDVHSYVVRWVPRLGKSTRRATRVSVTIETCRERLPAQQGQREALLLVGVENRS